MRKNLKIKVFSLLLCLVFVFLCSCDLGITPAQTEEDETREAGFSDIGSTSKSYGGIFNGVTEVYITIGKAELATVLDHADAGMYCECSARIGGTLVSGIGIKPRGNTDYVTGVGNGRYSFKLKFNKYTKGQKLNGLDELDLNNMVYDPSYVREYLAYMLFSMQGGISVPLATFAKVYINNEYYGLYLMAECIDESFLKRCFGDADGNLYEADQGSSLESADTSTFTLKRGEDDHLSKIVELYEAIEHDSLEDILDTESVLRYAAVMSVICGKESYIGPKAESYYLYSDKEGVMHIIPRDFKLTFGTDDNAKKTEYLIDKDLISESVNQPYFGLDGSDRPLVSKLLENETYKKEYLSYVKFYNDALKEMLSKLPELKEKIDSAVQDDPRRFYSDDVYQAEFTDGDTLYGFIKARCENVTSQLAETEK